MLKVVFLKWHAPDVMTRELNDACENGRWVVITATATEDEMVYTLFNYRELQPDPSINA